MERSDVELYLRVEYRSDSSLDRTVDLSSADNSEVAHEERFEGTVGERGGTISGNDRSSDE